MEAEKKKLTNSSDESPSEDEEDIIADPRVVKYSRIRIRFVNCVVMGRGSLGWLSGCEDVEKASRIFNNKMEEIREEMNEPGFGTLFSIQIQQLLLPN